jgi:hypothetical protein
MEIHYENIKEKMWDSLWNRELGLITFKICLPKIKQKNLAIEQEIVRSQYLEVLHGDLTIE